MEVTLLKEEQLWGDQALDIMQDDQIRRASLSDLAVLLGGWQSLSFQASDGESAGVTWSSSAGRSRSVRAVDIDGSRNCGNPNSRKIAIRPALSSSFTSSIRSSDVRAGQPVKGVQTVLYGKFPQTIAKNQDWLERLYQHNRLQTTGKDYAFDSVGLTDYATPYQKRTCTEYSFNNERYIRIEAKGCDADSALSNGQKPEEGKAYWVKVEPIEWLKDKSGVWVAKQALLSGMQFDRSRFYEGDFKNTDMYDRLQEFGSEMVVGREYAREEQRASQEIFGEKAHEGSRPARKEKARQHAKFGLKVEGKQMSAKDLCKNQAKLFDPRDGRGR